MTDAIAVAGLMVAVIAAYFAYVPIRGNLRRRRSAAPQPPPSEPGETYDVFVSYADADLKRAKELAAKLTQAGLRTFLAEWIEVGLVAYLEKEKALLGSANGVLMFSRTTMRQPAIRDEYAALLGRAHSGGRRLIPVLVEDVELPPFAAIRKPLDLRNADGADYDARVAQLIRAVRPRGPGHPT